MEYRKLGRSGLMVSEISLGSWETFGNTVNDQTAAECVRKAYDLGINSFDTADMYARGAAEEVLGKILAEFPRDSYILATKVFAPMGDWPTQKGLSRKHILESADASLKRLRMDHVDLYYIHRCFDDATPLEETLRAFDDLVRAGKVHYVGVSNCMADQILQGYNLAESMNLDRIVVNQPPYSMLCREIEKDIITTCEKLGVGQIIYSPLAQGVLTGKYSKGKIPQDSRAAVPGNEMGDVLTDENLDIVERLKHIAAELGMTMPQLALAWCLRHDNVTSVICGATKVSQIEDNAAASGKKIPEDALQKIEQILS